MVEVLAPGQVAQLRLLLTPAAGLAALMQQYYALPAAEAERQLQLAQAAAGRSCAYLRCANLGGEGGPAAGQGAGSKRCRCVIVHRTMQLNCLIAPARARACNATSNNVMFSPLPPAPLCVAFSVHSACRAVWYCGTACLHANWRQGGHGRVCQELGAARRAAKEAAAAAAAAPDAATGQE